MSAYLVVQFRKKLRNGQKSVSEVPASWVNVKKMSCRWPPLSTGPASLVHMIRNRTEPSSNFGTYGIVKILWKTGLKFSLL